jgi:4a-hydroxytetrahydrobiopterin dehydratase
MNDPAKSKSSSAPAALAPADVSRRLASLPGWQADGGAITKSFPFENYYQTIAFVNAIAWISHHQDHHPDLEVGYNKCRVTYSTHSVGDVSENDFLCAGKVEALMAS